MSSTGEEPADPQRQHFRQLPSGRLTPHVLYVTKKDIMKPQITMVQRALLAAMVLLVDLAVFFFPLTAVFLAYIILFNPLWFRELLDRHAQPSNH